MTHQKINFRLLSVIVRKSFLTCVWCVFFRVSLQVRMLTSVCIMTLCFVVTTVLVVIDTSNCKLSAVGILDFLTKFLKSLLVMLWFNITSGNNIRQLILPYTRVKLAFIYKLYNLYYSITSWYTCIYLLDLGVKYIEIVHSKNPNPVNWRSVRITFFVSCFSMLFSCLLKNNSALLPVNWLFLL